MEQHYKLYRIKELADGDLRFISAIAEAFLEEIPADALILKESVENENYLMTYQIAHKMKPTIDMFELGVLSELIEVQDWGKLEKRDDNVLPQLQIVLTAVESASQEIKTDFNL